MTVGIGADDVQANKDTRAQIKREGERLSFSRLTLRNEQNLRAAAYFPSKIDTSRLHRRFDSACIRLAFAAHSSLSLSIYLSSFFPTKRPNERANDGRKRREGNTRACLSILETQRREALWSLDEKRRRNGLEKESLGSVPLVTVNSNKRCLRIASFNRTGRQTFSRAENHRQKPYRNDALRSPRQFPPIRIENFQPVRLCFHLLEQVVRANAKIVRVFVNRAE